MATRSIAGNERKQGSARSLPERAALGRSVPAPGAGGSAS